MNRIKVVETSILYNQFGDVSDVQSRVVEIDSWDDYLGEVKGILPTTDKRCIFGNLSGRTASIVNSEYEHIGAISRETYYNLIYKVKHEDGSVTLHTAYRLYEDKGE